MLVEDNDINREFAVGLLNSMSIEVDEAVNGEVAVAMVQQQGGEYFAKLPIIAMTAMAKDAEQCRQVGMNDFVTKPVSPQVLMATLAKWLQVNNQTIAKKPVVASDGTECWL